MGNIIHIITVRFCVLSLERFTVSHVCSMSNPPCNMFYYILFHLHGTCFRRTPYIVFNFRLHDRQYLQHGIVPESKGIQIIIVFF